MDATRDPDTMTADERRREVASILALGLVRHHRMVQSLATGTCGDAKDSAQNPLDLSSETRLSVSPRPAG